MKVYEFDIQKGVYSFELTDLTTHQHAHPAVEMLVATKGTFEVVIDQQKYERLVFAVIDANVQHQVCAQDCTLGVLMLESNQALLSDFLNTFGVTLASGYFFKSTFTQANSVYKAAKVFAHENQLKIPTNPKIAQCLEIIVNETLEYTDLMPHLTAKICLSESRLSHLFKEHVGISLKKYLVWDKLRKTMLYYLNEDKTLTQSSLQNGFFDQAHLTNSFKNMLGLSPSKVYNSRTLQF